MEQRSCDSHNYWVLAKTEMSGVLRLILVGIVIFLPMDPIRREAPPGEGSTETFGSGNYSVDLFNKSY